MPYLTPDLFLETVLPCLQGSLGSPEAIGVLAIGLNFKCKVVHVIVASLLHMQVYKLVNTCRKAV
jgi:hypothetical protein